MDSVTAGSNTAVGYNAMHSETTGQYNVAIGSQCMADQNGATYNHGIGYRALRNATGGSSQAIGTRALQDMTSGHGNNAIGYEAGDDITTGYTNQCIGSQAGSVITTGYENQVIGRLANPSAADGNNQVVIGHNITGKGNNTAFIGGSSGAYNQANSSSWSTTSDERIKKNIVDNNSGLDILNQIQIRNFEYRTEEEIIDFDNPKAVVVKKEGVQVGVIAQELEKILPECVKTQSTGAKTVESNNLTWYLINAVKELSAEVKALKAA